jgi:hypothetical protein
MCFGNCPAYAITVYDDGKVHYEGRAYVVTMGGKDGKLTPEDVAKVRAAFDGTSFFSLCDTPEDKTSSTDAPDTNIYFSDGKRSKYLLTYWGNPRSARVVNEIAKRIDDIVHIEQYIGTLQEREKIPNRP